MNDFSIAEFQATLRADFHSFLVRCFLELNSGASFLPSWHIEVMAAKLQAVRDGRIRRLIINIPPRHLKSLASSIALPAWLLGHNPALAIINVTYGQELSDKFARDCRAIMMTPWYQLLFATAGEALHPERESLETLRQIRSTIGEYNFAGQYQQTPAPAGGGMIKEAWFRRYRSEDLPSSFDQVIQSWDTANKPSELADYSVCTTWGVKSSNLYLLNVLRKKLSYPDLKRAVIEQNRLFNPTMILIEDKASGTQLIQELIETGLSRVTRYAPDGDKIMRLHAQTATIENGFVYLPIEAQWVDDYLRELMLFPAGRHDDQVDSTAQALAWTKQRPPGWGWLEFMRQQADEAQGHR